MTDKQKVFIRGVEGRGDEVINALKAVGGKTNWDDMISGDDDQWIYMINHEGLIDSWPVACETGKIITECYREIKLPEKWKDGTVLFSPLYRTFAVCTAKEDTQWGDVLVHFVLSDNAIEYSCSIAKRDYRIANKKERKRFSEWLHKLGKDWDAEKAQFVNWKWKPKDGEEYWFFTGSSTIIRSVWADTLLDNKYFEFGNCFQSRKEAVAAAERVKKALKGE